MRENKYIYKYVCAISWKSLVPKINGEGSSPRSDTSLVCLWPYVSLLSTLPALAKAGVHVSFVSTPRNIQRLPKVPPNLAPLIDLVEFPLLTLDNEILPNGAEATVDIPLDKVEHFKIAYDLLQIPFKKFIRDQLPDWIIVDFCAHWAVDIAQEYNVKLVLFTVMSAATTVFLGRPPGYVFLSDQTPTWPSPESLTKPPEWVSFPSSVAWREYEAPFVHATLYTKDASGISGAARISKVLCACNALAIRSCKEFEGEYLNLHEKQMGKPAPQMEILAHPAIGGSLFHSGWGSVIEILQFGHSLIVLLLVYDQSLNAGLLVDKDLAVEVERGKDGSFDRDSLAKALRLAMVSEEGKTFRVRARKAAAIFGDENLHQQYYIDRFVEYLKNRE
ncbi:putative udp-rhamnose:rhamnosyltransferase 1 [Quercus suber]|uniref:Udp-rhamnose:rhamnosyltransferase 1 n=1 Tax=Quercus suber TaxID=58331 RepID=A0AAW0KQS1_QUESU